MVVCSRHSKGSESSVVVVIPPHLFVIHRPFPDLLGRALHSFCTLRHAVFFLLFHAGSSLGSSLSALVNLLEREVINHGVARRHRLWLALRQDLFKLGNFLGSVEAWRREFDVKLDVEVTEVVVSQ